MANCENLRTRYIPGLKFVIVFAKPMITRRGLQP